MPWLSLSSDRGACRHGGAHGPGLRRDAHGLLARPGLLPRLAALLRRRRRRRGNLRSDHRQPLPHARERRHRFLTPFLAGLRLSHRHVWQVLLVTFPRFFFKGLLEDTKRTGFLARLCCGGGAKPRVSQQPPSGVSAPGSPAVSARASPSVSASRHSRFKDPPVPTTISSNRFSSVSQNHRRFLWRVHRRSWILHCGMHLRTRCAARSGSLRRRPQALWSCWRTRPSDASTDSPRASSAVSSPGLCCARAASALQLAGQSSYIDR